MFDSHPIYVPVAAATAGTAADLFTVNGMPGQAKIVGCYLVADGAITANDTNYATLTLTVGGTTVGTMSTTITAGTGDIADGGVASMTLTAAGSNLVGQGEAIKCAITKPGTGVAVAGTVVVALEQVRAD